MSRGLCDVARAIVGDEAAKLAHKKDETQIQAGDLRSRWQKQEGPLEPLTGIPEGWCYDRHGWADKEDPGSSEQTRHPTRGGDRKRAPTQTPDVPRGGTGSSRSDAQGRNAQAPDVPREDTGSSRSATQGRVFPSQLTVPSLVPLQQEDVPPVDSGQARHKRQRADGQEQPSNVAVVPLGGEETGPAVALGSRTRGGSEYSTPLKVPSPPTQRDWYIDILNQRMSDVEALSENLITQEARHSERDTRTRDYVSYERWRRNAQVTRSFLDGRNCGPNVEGSN